MTNQEHRDPIFTGTQKPTSATVSTASPEPLPSTAPAESSRRWLENGHKWTIEIDDFPIFLSDPPFSFGIFCHVTDDTILGTQILRDHTFGLCLTAISLQGDEVLRRMLGNLTQMRPTSRMEATALCDFPTFHADSDI